MIDEKVTLAWQRYQIGVDHHRGTNMYNDIKRCHNFYEGKQWQDIQSGGEELPIYNFIKPTGRYKISMIAQNLMSINYSDMSSDEKADSFCELLNVFARQQWERLKMDTISWKVIKNAFISGDHYVYFFDKKERTSSVMRDTSLDFGVRLIDKTNIYLSDEQEQDLNMQEWIIIAERLSVSQVRKQAKDNGLSLEQIELITSDDESNTTVTSKDEVQTELGKCTSLLHMSLQEDGLHFSRSTMLVDYQPEQVISDLDMYPVCAMVWEDQFNSARGQSGVISMIPNQLEVNKTAARRSITIKRTAYPTMVYDNDIVDNIDNLNSVGGSISVSKLRENPISDAIQYLTPPQMSTDAEKFQQELMTMTRELEGAGDSATGQVDPTKASGEAIRAARDQSAMPLNEQIQHYKQFVEDVARLWLKMWIAYSPDGLEITQKDEDATAYTDVISQQELKGLNLSVKIDVSPVDPYSKASQEIALERVFMSPLAENTGLLEEYAMSLSDDSTVPKDKLQDIVDKRKQAEQDQKDLMIEQQNLMIQELQLQLDEMLNNPRDVEQTQMIEDLTAKLQANEVLDNEMSYMPNGNVDKEEYVPS